MGPRFGLSLLALSGFAYLHWVRSSITALRMGLLPAVSMQFAHARLSFVSLHICMVDAIAWCGKLIGHVHCHAEAKHMVAFTGAGVRFAFLSFFLQLACFRAVIVCRDAKTMVFLCAESDIAFSFCPSCGGSTAAGIADFRSGNVR